jgi:hypothetical protein
MEMTGIILYQNFVRRTSYCQKAYLLFRIILRDILFLSPRHYSIWDWRDKLTIDNVVQMEDFISEVVEALVNMHVVQENENVSYETYSERISLIARMMWERRETADWKVNNG